MAGGMFVPHQIEKCSRNPCVSHCHSSHSSVCQLSLRVWYEKPILQTGALASDQFFFLIADWILLQHYVCVCVWESVREAFV